MAIEDGLCLADCIAAGNGDYEAAFGRYENARAVRTALDTGIPQYLGHLPFGRHHARGLLADAERTQRSRHVPVPCAALRRIGIADLNELLAQLLNGSL